MITFPLPSAAAAVLRSVLSALCLSLTDSPDDHTPVVLVIAYPCYRVDRIARPEEEEENSVTCSVRLRFLRGDTRFSICLFPQYNN